MRSLKWILASSLVAVLAACGGGGTTTPPADTTKPTVSLGASSTNVVAAGDVTLTATAADNVGVTKVEFYEGATKLSEDTTAPYTHTLSFTAASNGSKSYTARAFDAAGNNETSAAVSVTVNIVVPDTDAPTVVSIVPANNATGVLNNANIVITFSERMNQAATQSAYQSATNGIRPADVSFSWNPEGTVLTINPNADLPYATGTTAAVVANSFAFSLTNTATDIAGNALAATPVNSSFRTLRDITQTLTATALSGDVRSDGAVNSGDCPGFICVGDSSSVGNATYRGYLTFDLSVLVSTLDPASIQSATLRMNQSAVAGAPYEDLEDCNTGGGPLPIITCSDLLAQHVNYGATLTDTDFDTNSLRGLSISGCVLLSGCPSGNGYKEANALVAVQEDWTNRAARGNRSQYRLRFARNTDGDGAADIARFTDPGDAPANQLVIRYLVP